MTTTTTTTTTTKSTTSTTTTDNFMGENEIIRIEHGGMDYTYLYKDIDKKRTVRFVRQGADLFIYVDSVLAATYLNFGSGNVTVSIRSMHNSSGGWSSFDFDNFKVNSVDEIDHPDYPIVDMELTLENNIDVGFSLTLMNNLRTVVEFSLTLVNSLSTEIEFSLTLKNNLLSESDDVEFGFILQNHLLDDITGVSYSRHYYSPVHDKSISTTTTTTTITTTTTSTTTTTTT